MATYIATTAFIPTFLDDNGDPLNGGTLESYIAGTTAPTPTFTGEAGVSAGNIITLNARGEPETSGNTHQVWIDSAIKYDFVLKTAAGVIINSPEDVRSAVMGSVASSLNITETKALAVLEDTQAVYMRGYTAAGDGGGGMYVYDASSAATANDGTVLALDTLPGRLLHGETTLITGKTFGILGGTDDTAAMVNILAMGGNIELDGIINVVGSTLFSLTGLNYFNITSGTRLRLSARTEIRILANQLADGTRFEITGDNVVVEGGTFKEVNATLGRHNFYGTLAGVGASNVVIRNVKVDGSNGAGMHFRSNCNNFNIIEPVIINTKADGLHIQRGSNSFTIEGPHIEANEDDCIGIVGHGRNEGFARPYNIEILGGYLGPQANGAVGSGLGIIGASDVRAIGVKCQSNGLSGIRITDFTDATEGNYATSDVLIESPQCYDSGLTASGVGGLVKDGITIANCRNVRIENPDVIGAVNSGITVSNSSIDVQINNPKIRESGARGIWVAAAASSAAHILELANDYNDSRYSSATTLKCEYLRITSTDVQTSNDDGIYFDGAATGDIVNPTLINLKADTSNEGNTAGKYGIFMSDTVGLNLNGMDGGESGSATAITPIVFVNADYDRISGLASNYTSTTYPLDTKGSLRHFRNSAIPTGAPAVGADYAIGDIIWNTNPAAGTIFWVCTVAGSSDAGTWVAVT